MTLEVRLAVCAAALVLGLGACSTREHAPGDLADAATDGDAAITNDALDDGGSADGADAATDAPTDLGPPCVLGGTTVLLPATLGCTDTAPGRIVVDGDHVYWTVQGAGAIVVRAALSGGGPEPLAFDAAGAFGLAVDSRYVYYTQRALGRLMRVPKAGGTPTVLATKLDAPLFLTLAEASDGPSLFWTGGQIAGAIMKLALAPDARPVTLVDGQSAPRAIAAQGGFVYWTDFVDGTLLRTPDHLTGPADAGVRTANRLASGLAQPSDLVLAGGFAYVPDHAGAIKRVPLDGGDLETVSDGHGTPNGLATDGLTLFWTTLGEGGSIFSAPLGVGVTATPFVDGLDDPHFLAVTAENVYWSTYGGYPAVHRLAR
jgi:hypothetical protein